MQSRFQKALTGESFAVSCEVVPRIGAVSKVLSQSKELYCTGQVDAISVADNPDGVPAMLADAFAMELASENIPSIVQFCARDRNRNQIASQLAALQRAKLFDVCAMTGDYPGETAAWERASAVFEVDSIGIVGMMEEMNREPALSQGEGFFPGAVVSPFKWTREEAELQYLKAIKKVNAGARYLIAQMGYDSRKAAELAAFAKGHWPGVKLMSHVFVLNSKLAIEMNAGHFPGCYAGDRLVEDLIREESSPDRGRAARLHRAGAQVAVARGLGYDGVHLGGVNMNAEGLTEIMQTAQSLYSSWEEEAALLNYCPENGFYFAPGEAESLSPQDRYGDEEYMKIVSGCPKHLRQGPCGGSMDGRCEVGSGKRLCSHVLASKKLGGLS